MRTKGLANVGGNVKKLAFGCLMLCTAAACFGQDQMPLCPKHIEAPGYPVIARVAHVTGKITLTVTIDADGNVVHVDTTADDPREQAIPVLEKFAVENIQHWTFAKPPSAPYKQAVVYDYEFDPALPAAGGKHDMPVVTLVSFDLPDRVTITTNPDVIRGIDTSRIHN
jgi:Gram-negative bacterial TonB protein C-terminal